MLSPPRAQLSRSDVVRNLSEPTFSVTSLVPVASAVAADDDDAADASPRRRRCVPRQQLAVVAFVLRRHATARGARDADDEPARSHLRIEARDDLTVTS